MEIIEKEKVKEVPADYWCDRYGYGGNRNIRGLAGTALGLTR